MALLHGLPLLLFLVSLFLGLDLLEALIDELADRVGIDGGRGPGRRLGFLRGELPSEPECDGPTRDGALQECTHTEHNLSSASPVAKYLRSIGEFPDGT